MKRLEKLKEAAEKQIKLADGLTESAVRFDAIGAAVIKAVAKKNLTILRLIELLEAQHEALGIACSLCSRKRAAAFHLYDKFNDDES